MMRAKPTDRVDKCADYSSRNTDHMTRSTQHVTRSTDRVTRATDQARIGGADEIIAIADLLSEEDGSGLNFSALTKNTSLPVFDCDGEDVEEGLCDVDPWIPATDDRRN